MQQSEKPSPTLTGNNNLSTTDTGHSIKLYVNYNLEVYKFMQDSMCTLFSTWKLGGSATVPMKRYHYVMSPQYLHKEPSSKLSCILHLGYFRRWTMSNIFIWLTKHSKWILKELPVITFHPLRGNHCTSTLYYMALDTENYKRNSISWHYCNWYAKKICNISAAKCFSKHSSYYPVLKFTHVKRDLAQNGSGVPQAMCNKIQS